MCARSYRSKYDKNGFLDHPQILHSLNLETSDSKVITSLKKLGLPISAAKKGKRVRMTSVDFSYLGGLAKKIQQEVGGFIEVKMNIAKNKKQHLKSLVIPAQNVFPGMSLPVMSDKGLIYEEIISRTEKEKIETVYDLEISRTHNFIADGIAVHNSIYKFRGASISNIMQFKDDYPHAKEIVLIDNYRSRQEILDHAYKFIKNNDPNRLEVKLKIDKQLKAGGAFENNDENPACYLQFDRGEDEVGFVAAQIADLYKQKKELNWLDMAILVRANDTAEAYVKELTRLGIPNQFVSLKGLYYKPLILDCLAYLRLLDNYHESSALFRVLSMSAFKVSHLDLININKYARQKVWSLFEALKNCSVIPGISNEALVNIDKLLTLLDKHSALVAEMMPTKIFLRFVYDSGLISEYDFDRDQEIFSYLNQFYQKIKKFEETLPGARLRDFMELMDLEMEAGEVGALRLDFSDNDTVKIMTVHAAKGLEFKHVFLVNAVDKKFPTISRSEKISIPDALVKEKMVGGKEAHLEEERRLFYVAITRAKESLYITGAKDYGGAREKKPSLFISEMGLDVLEVNANNNLSGKSELLRDLKRLDALDIETPEALVLPDRFSFSQLAAFSTCPLQYKFAFVLKIPAPSDKASLIFGRVLHNVLYEFLEPLLASKQAFQDNLFDNTKTSLTLTEEKILDIYERRWQSDGYASPEERDSYYQKGKLIVKQFLTNWNSEAQPEVLFLEKSFSFKVGGDIIKGAIDRIDRLSDGTLEVIDYKTGNPKVKLAYEDKRQLILYKIFLEETYNQKVSLLSYYYLESGHKVSFVATDKEIEKLRSEILKEIAEIKKANFPPKPSELCKYCDFRSICEFKQN
jgi:DNA helicase-2/ATP-dependent DNA helicase PcrA